MVLSRGYRCEAGPNEGQNAGVGWEGGRVAWLTGARWTDTSWSPIHPPRARREFELWTAAHRVVLPLASLSDDVALTPRPL